MYVYIYIIYMRIYAYIYVYIYIYIHIYTYINIYIYYIALICYMKFLSPEVGLYLNLAYCYAWNTVAVSGLVLLNAS